jgi:DNA-binding HxlR family transcriptional regulator
MHQKKNFSKRMATSSLDVALNTISGKWKLLILYALIKKTYRTHELQKQLPEISERILIRQLRSLEKNLLITRKVTPSVPPKVEYSITAYGKSLEKIIHELSAWGYGHFRKMNLHKDVVVKVKQMK